MEAKADGLSTNQISETIRDLINNDTQLLVDSPRVENNQQYRAFVRGSSDKLISETNRSSSIRKFPKTEILSFMEP